MDITVTSCDHQSIIPPCPSPSFMLPLPCSIVYEISHDIASTALQFYIDLLTVSASVGLPRTQGR